MNVAGESNPILVIYTGGTIGMAPSIDVDPTSPLVAGSWHRLATWIPQLEHLGFAVRPVSIRHPIDSSDVTQAEWAEIAETVRDHYDECAGVVILHGTDTMAYTATALAFMLRNLRKPVVVTGAQLPISAPGTDAVQNLVNALRIAAGPAAGVKPVPEVCLYFRDRLLRGCRATKMSANGFDAFHSPNYPDLGRVDHRITVHTRHIRPPATEPLDVRVAMSSGVVVIQVTPGLDPVLLRELLLRGEVRGVVLLTYGAGNVPLHTGLVELIGVAVATGKAVINATQCAHGRVEEGMYAGSAKLRSVGVLSGGDMTAEAAVIKLQIALAQHAGDPDAIRRFITEDCVGERS